MDGSTVGLIFAGVGVVSAVLGTVIQTRNNAHNHGRTTGIVEEGMRGIRSDVSMFRADTDRRFDKVERDQDQLRADLRTADSKADEALRDVSYLKGKVNSRHSAAT